MSQFIHCLIGFRREFLSGDDRNPGFRPAKAPPPFLRDPWMASAKASPTVTSDSMPSLVDSSSDAPAPISKAKAKAPWVFASVAKAVAFLRLEYPKSKSTQPVPMDVDYDARYQGGIMQGATTTGVPGVSGTSSSDENSSQRHRNTRFRGRNADRVLDTSFRRTMSNPALPKRNYVRPPPPKAPSVVQGPLLGLQLDTVTGAFNAKYVPAIDGARTVLRELSRWQFKEPGPHGKIQ